MRKIFVSLLACLLLGGAAAGALAASSQPIMVVAQNAPVATEASHEPDQADRAARLKARCENRYAEAVGRMAYLETRLNLTGPQQAPFAAWRSVRLNIAKQHADACAQRDFGQDRQNISPMDRMTRMEDRLKRRVADLDAERPAFAALYDTLTPDQRKAFMPNGHSMIGRHRMVERGMMRRGGMDGRASAPMQR